MISEIVLTVLKKNKSLLKQPKYYFYDTGLIKDRGAAFENLVACSLLKENHFREIVMVKREGFII